MHYEDSYQPVGPTGPAHNSSQQSLTLPVLSSQVVPVGCSPGEVIYMDMREAGIASWSTWMVGNRFLRVPLLPENWISWHEIVELWKVDIFLPQCVTLSAV